VACGGRRTSGNRERSHSTASGRRLAAARQQQQATGQRADFKELDQSIAIINNKKKRSQERIEKMLIVRTWVWRRGIGVAEGHGGAGWNETKRRRGARGGFKGGAMGAARASG